ncbi:hypothetical protein [Embleya scabrispora]|nr:hypothetical protein [Embleya scabrispora]
MRDPLLVGGWDSGPFGYEFMPRRPEAPAAGARSDASPPEP